MEIIEFKNIDYISCDYLEQFIYMIRLDDKNNIYNDKDAEIEITDYIDSHDFRELEEGDAELCRERSSFKIIKMQTKGFYIVIINSLG